MYLEAQIAVAKIGKYASGESGDTLEMVERPHGGLSFVLVDGQRSGKPAKAVSNLVARKALSLLAEGVRDGAAARAAHDYLYTHHGGKVSATLNIVSLDLETKTAVISRNSHCPAWVATAEGLRCLDEPSQPVGIYPMTKPVIVELPLQPDMYIIAFTDGLLAAGQRTGHRLDIPSLIASLLAADDHSAHAIADGLLAAALELDQGRPSDDTSVLVVALLPQIAPNDIRRLEVFFPIGPM